MNSSNRAASGVLRAISALVACVICSLFAGSTVQAQSSGPSEPAYEEGAGGNTLFQHVEVLRSEASVVISWTSTRPSIARVEYGTGPGELSHTALDDRSPNRRKSRHRVTIDGIGPDVTLFFRLYAGDYVLDNSGAPFELAGQPQGSEPQADTIDLAGSDPDVSSLESSAVPERFPIPALPVGALLSDGQFVYGPNVGDFDVAAYIAEHVPLLNPHADFLYGYAKRLSINPKVLLTLMEMQSGIISSPSSASVDSPFGLDTPGFTAQLELVGEALVGAFYQRLYEGEDSVTVASSGTTLELENGEIAHVPAGLNAGTFATYAAIGQLAADADTYSSEVSLSSHDGFYQTYRRLFPDDDPLDLGNVIGNYPNGYAGGVVIAPPPPNMFQLPYRRGQKWSFNGVHNALGGTTPADMAAIDFSKSESPWPADYSKDTTDWRVVAAAQGKGTKVANCYYEVTHVGWTTTYYHLTSVIGSTELVGQDHQIGVPNPRYDDPGANGGLCLGGKSSAIHLHFALKNASGAYYPLNGTYFSGWRVTSGAAQYDDAGTYMLKLGFKRTSRKFLLNDLDSDDNRLLGQSSTLTGTVNPSDDIDTYTFSGVQGEIVTLRMNAASSSSVNPFLSLYKPDGTWFASNDNYNGTVNSLIFKTLPATGTYTVFARAAASTTGAYTLSRSSTAPPCYPGPNGVILYDSPNYGSTERCITKTGDDFNLMVDELFDNRTSSVRLVGSYATGWEVILFRDAYYSGPWVLIRSKAPSISPWSIGDNAVSSIQLYRDPDDFRTVTVGQSVSGTMHRNADVDRYYFEGRQGQAISIEMKRTVGNLDSYLVLLDSNSSAIAQDDDSAGERNARIRTTLPSTGRFYVLARSYNSSSSGTYSLDISEFACPDNQFRAEYFNNSTLSGAPVHVACESAPIYRNWGTGSPGNGIPNDYFSIRWKGRFTFTGESYYFTMRSDDGLRLSIDGDYVFNRWILSDGSQAYANIRAPLNGTHEIVLEYFEQTGSALIETQWRRMGPNLAYGRPAYASSVGHPDYGPSRAVDANISTRFTTDYSGSSSEQWLYYNYGTGNFKPHNFVAIYWEAAYATRYRLTCHNGSGWLRSSEISASRSGWQYVRFSSSTSCQSVGISLLQRAPNMSNYSFYEFQVYNLSSLLATEMEWDTAYWIEE